MSQLFSARIAWEVLLCQPTGRSVKPEMNHRHVIIGRWFKLLLCSTPPNFLHICQNLQLYALGKTSPRNRLHRYLSITATRRTWWCLFDSTGWSSCAHPLRSPQQALFLVLRCEKRVTDRCRLRGKYLQWLLRAYNSSVPSPVIIPVGNLPRPTISGFVTRESASSMESGRCCFEFH